MRHERRTLALFVGPIGSEGQRGTRRHAFGRQARLPALAAVSRKSCDRVGAILLDQYWPPRAG